MSTQPCILGFSLTAGGALHRLFVALGADSPWGLLRIAAVFALAAWLPLLVSSIAEGLVFGWPGSFAADVGVHARFLIVLPIALWAERPISGRFDRALCHLVEAGVIDDGNRSAVTASIRRAERLRDLPFADAVLAACAVSLSGIDAVLHSHGARTWVFGDTHGDALQLSTAGWIYLTFSVPVFRFIGLRWLWRVVIWTVALMGLARSRLRIDPLHPDGRGGLAVLFAAHTSFGWLLFGGSVSLAGNLWTEMTLLERSITAYQREIAAFVVFTPLVLLLPLFAFSWPLECARRQFSQDYGVTAANFARRYARRWLRDPTHAELPLGTDETSAHTDLVTSFERVQTTHWFPFSKSEYVTLFVVGVTPMVIVAMRELPLIEILQRINGVLQ